MPIPQIQKNLLSTNNVGSGGWIYATIKGLLDMGGVEAMAIASVGSNEGFSMQHDGIVSLFHIHAKRVSIINQIGLWKQLQKAIDMFKPDLIDVQGIEFDYVSIQSRLNLNCPVLFTLQGLPSELHRVYDLGLSKYAFCLDRFCHKHILSIRGKRSVEALRMAQNVTGRTCWDNVNVKKHNVNLNYYHVNRVLRDDFYDKKWDINKIQRKMIFTIQGEAPYKGLHILFEAISILKKYHSDILLCIPGKVFIDKKKKNGYHKYLSNLIKKFNLSKNIKFTGPLSSQEIQKALRMANVFVLPSIMENSPNSLAEAQILGVPCVATFSGGTVDYIQDGLSGLFYNCLDAAMCARQLDRVLNDDNLAVSLSACGRKEALERHNKEKNINQLYSVYKTILQNY